MYGVIQKYVQSVSGKPEGKRPLGRPRRKWEYNIKMDLWEVGCDSGDWIDFAEDRDQWRAYVRAVMNIRVPLKPVSQLFVIYFIYLIIKTNHFHDVEN